MALIKRTATSPRPADTRGKARSLAGLTEELDSDNPVARRWAARDLVSHPEASAALVNRLAREEDASVREVILLTLTEIGGAEAVDALVECLRSEDAALRNEAIEAMKNLPEAVAPIMAGLLEDADPDVRIFAVNVLESLRHPNVERWLISVIEQDPHVNVCATAVDLLGEVGSKLSVLPLQQLKQRFPNEPYIGFAADLALNRIREA